MLANTAKNQGELYSFITQICTRSTTAADLEGALNPGVSVGNEAQSPIGQRNLVLPVDQQFLIEVERKRGLVGR
jgi:hypothetical protein